MSIEKIQSPIAEHLKRFETHFRQSAKSSVPLLDVITNYIFRQKGKQIRPIFVFLTAAMVGKITESTYTAASLIELLHTATLIHDDVVDESYQRRGLFSINALWKSKISVLVGDFFLSKGLLLAVSQNELELLKIFSEAVREMAEGELIQIEKARRLNVTEEIYFEIIRKKTAVLIASCTAGGALSAGADVEKINLLKKFGENVGIAFQIKDDIFDYQPNNLTGKPAANDIQEKKLTLPLIFSLKNSTYSEKKKILDIVKHHNKDRRKIKEVIDFVHFKGGLEYSVEKMNFYKQESLDILKKFSDNSAKESLIELVNYTVSRNK